MKKIKIESIHPVPKGHFSDISDLGILRKTLQQMKPGHSFVWNKESTSVYQAAKSIDAKVITRKLDKKGFRVWRVK